MRFHVTLHDTAAHVDHWSIVEAASQREAYCKARDQIVDSIADAEGIDSADTHQIEHIYEALDFVSIAHAAS